MTIARTLSWLELIVAFFLAILAIWLFFGYRGDRSVADPHGYFASSGVAALILACVLALGGALLRLSTKWRWLGQAPLLAFILTMGIFIYI